MASMFTWPNPWDFFLWGYIKDCGHRHRTLSHQCPRYVSSWLPLSGETCKYALVPNTQTNLERFSTYWYAPFSCVCLGSCAAEFGISGGTYELPCIPSMQCTFILLINSKCWPTNLQRTSCKYFYPLANLLDCLWQARKQIFLALGQTDLRETDNQLGLYSPVVGICAGCNEHPGMSKHKGINLSGP
jgi:hypothetical protein